MTISRFLKVFVHKNSLLAWKPTKIVPLTVSVPFIGYIGNLYDFKCFYEYTLVNVCHADADNMHLCVDYFVKDSHGVEWSPLSVHRTRL